MTPYQVGLLGEKVVHVLFGLLQLRASLIELGVKTRLNDDATLAFRLLVIEGGLGGESKKRLIRGSTVARGQNYALRNGQQT